MFDRFRPSRRAAAVAVLAAAALASQAACSKRPAEVAATGRYLVFATNESSGDLAVLDGASRKLIKTIPLGKRPRGLAVSPDGKTLFITLSGSPIAGPGVDESKLPPPDKSADGIGVFDIASLSLKRVLRGTSNPEQIAATPGGKLVVADEATGKAEILDAQSGDVAAAIPVGDEPEGVAVSPDGRFAYVTSEGDGQLTVIDLARNAKLKTLKIADRPRGIIFSPDSAHAYITGENDRSVTALDAHDHTITGRLTIPGDNIKPMGLAISPDGRHLYVTTGRGGELASIALPAFTLEKTVAVGARPWGVAVSPDGRAIFTANGPSNDVSVIDAQTFAVVQKVPTGQRPWGVVTAAAPK